MASLNSLTSDNIFGFLTWAFRTDWTAGQPSHFETGFWALAHYSLISKWAHLAPMCTDLSPVDSDPLYSFFDLVFCFVDELSAKSYENNHLQYNLYSKTSVNVM